MHALVRQFWRKMGVLTIFPSSLSTGPLLLVLPPFLGDVPFPPTIPRPRVPLAVFIRAMADMYKYIYYKLCCTAALNDESSGDKRLQLVASSPPPSPLEKPARLSPTIKSVRLARLSSLCIPKRWMHVSDADNVATPPTMPSHSNRTRKRRESLSHLSSGLRHYGAKIFCENCAKTAYAKIARKHLRPPPLQGTMLWT